MMQLEIHEFGLYKLELLRPRPVRDLQHSCIHDIVQLSR